MNKNSFVSLKNIVYLALLTLLAGALLWRAAETSAQPGRVAQQSPEQKSAGEAFDSFDEWVGQYLRGNAADDAGFIAQGETLAAARRAAFGQLIRNNPKAAIETAIPAEIQSRLPFPVTRQLEKSISARGDFLVTAFDDFDGASGGAHRLEREIVIGEARYKAFVYGRKLSMTTKLDVPFRGVALGDLIAVDEHSIERIERAAYDARGVDPSKAGANGVAALAGGEIVYFAGEREFEEFVRELEIWESKPAPNRSDLSPWTEGQKRLLFIRVDFPDRPGVPVDRFGQVLTEEFSLGLIDGPVNEFFVGNSYGETSLRATVTPVVRMPQPQSAYPQNNLNQLLSDARDAAFAAGYNTDEYQLDMVAFAQSPLLGWSGISPLANKGALINGNFTFKVITHELGHAYGLVHANLWRTTDGTVTGNGANVEYGDDFDMMGRGNTQATHFNAHYKRTLDWLTDANIRTVTRPGVYRVFAHDATAPSPAGIRALRVRKDADRDYWIEFRQQLTNFPNLMNGATIRWDYAFNAVRQTQLLDIDPRTPGLEDSALTVGQTFADESGGIKFTVLGKGNTTPESLDVKVDINYSIARGAPFDFDGDGKSDIGVFRPSNAVWYLNNSSQGFSAAQFGLETDRIAPAKFDGDRKTDLAVFRDGVWYVLNSGGFYLTIQFGLAGDIPVAADYDGDGTAEMAVFRPSNGTWYQWNWVYQRFSAVRFGLSGDVPVPGDYDGDGKTDAAVYRPSSGVWYLLQSANGFAAAQFGLPTDQPVAGDFDGDGCADIAVFRPAEGRWYLLQSTAGFAAVNWGLSGDAPVPADYDGDGKTDLAVYRPTEGVWYIFNSANGAFVAARFGLNGDVPVSKGNG